MNKVLGGVRCEGDEKKLHQCYHQEIGNGVTCDSVDHIAGVICTDCKFNSTSHTLKPCSEGSEGMEK